MARRKYEFADRASAEAEVTRLRTSETLHRHMLADVLNGHIEHIARINGENYYVSRLDGFAGGLVMVAGEKYATVATLDAWKERALKDAQALGLGEPDAVKYRDAVARALQRRKEVCAFNAKVDEARKNPAPIIPPDLTRAPVTGRYFISILQPWKGGAPRVMYGAETYGSREAAQTIADTIDPCYQAKVDATQGNALVARAAGLPAPSDTCAVCGKRPPRGGAVDSEMCDQCSSMARS